MKFGVIERMADVQEMLEQQLGKEKTAMSLYQDGRQLVQKSTINVKDKNIFERLVRYDNFLNEDVVTTNEINIVLERHESEELRHIKICEDCIATLKMLRGKKS